MAHAFHSVTPEQRAAYDKEALVVINNRDMDTLRKWHKEGRTIQAANAFGESLLHIACRRGHVDVVEYMIKEAAVSLWVYDDMGRTPLHYACWTPEPRFDLIDLVLEHDQNLLLVSDKRGHTAMDYTRKSHWREWIEHFQRQNWVEELMPTRSEFYSDGCVPSRREDSGKRVIG